MADDETGTATGGDSTDQERDATGSSESTGTAETARDDDALQKALRSERQQRAAAEKRLKQYEDAQKTELEKANERATAAEARAAAAEQAYLRARIAAEFNLTPAIAERLRGDDEKSMRADAEVLVAEIDPDGDLGARRGGQRAPAKNDPNAALRALFNR